MPQYVEFPLEGGGSILIEAADESRPQAGFTRTGSGEAMKDLASQAKGSFEDAIENVRKSANSLVNRLRDLRNPPDEMEVRFSLKASAELGRLAVGKAGAEANYGVTLRWKREGREERKEAEDSGQPAPSPDPADQPASPHPQPAGAA